MWVYDSNQNKLVEQPEGINISGGSGASGQASGQSIASGAVASQAGPAPTSSGGFTDASRYLNMNQGQTEALGQKVAGSVGAQVDKAQEAVNTHQADFNKSISDAANQGLSTDQINQLKDAGNLRTFASDTANVDKFKTTTAGKYTGPQSISEVGDYEGLTKLLNPIKQLPKQVETSGGRQELVKTAYTRPERATQGMLGLDAALLNQTPTAFEPIKAQANRAPEIQKQWDDFSAKGTEQIQSTQKDIADRAALARSTTKSVYDTTTGGIDSRLKEKETSIMTGADTANNLMNKSWLLEKGILTQDPTNTKTGFKFNSGKFWEQAFDFETGKLKPEFQNAFTQLGINTAEFMNMLRQYSNPQWTLGQDMDKQGGVKVDPSWVIPDFDPYYDIGSPVTANLSRETIANEDEYATLAALDALMGDELPKFLTGDASQSGKYSEDIVNYDHQKLMEYLNKPKTILPGVTSSWR